MRFLRVLSVVVFCGFVFSGCSLPGQKSGLILTVMNSEPAEILISGKKVGEAPLQKNDIKPGTYDISIVPKDASKQPYQTKLQFVGGVTTRMNWNIGNTVDESSGEVFESKPGSVKDKSQLSVVTIPDTAIVRIDGQSRGLSPLSLDVDSGTRDIQVSAPGYFERRVTPTIPKGMNTQITVKLAVNRQNIQPSAPVAPSINADSATKSASPSPSPMTTPKPTVAPSVKATSSSVLKSTPFPSASPKITASPTPKPSALATPKPATSSGTVRGSSTIATPYVEIQTTPTGWLRVRDEANSSGGELAKLDSGKKVPYAGESKNGWLKVEYATGKEGWVSAEYADLVK